MSALSRELLEEGRRPYLFYLIDNVAAAQVYLQLAIPATGHWSVASALCDQEPTSRMNT